MSALDLDLVPENLLSLEFDSSSSVDDAIKNNFHHLDIQLRFENKELLCLQSKAEASCENPSSELNAKYEPSDVQEVLENRRSRFANDITLKCFIEHLSNKRQEFAQKFFESFPESCPESETYHAILNDFRVSRPEDLPTHRPLKRSMNQPSMLFRLLAQHYQEDLNDPSSIVKEWKAFILAQPNQRSLLIKRALETQRVIMILFTQHDPEILNSPIKESIKDFVMIFDHSILIPGLGTQNPEILPLDTSVVESLLCLCDTPIEPSHCQLFSSRRQTHPPCYHKKPFVCPATLLCVSTPVPDFPFSIDS